MTSELAFDIDFVSFFVGNEPVGAALYRRLQGPLLRQVRRRAPDLSLELAEDVVMEVFALMKQRGCAFDPTRGSAQAFITASLLPEAVRRVRAENACPGMRKRERVPTVSNAPMPTASLEEIPAVASTGRGSPEAIEAACDTRMIWAWATPSMRGVMGGLLEGESQADIASAMNLNRFKVGRMIKTLREFAAAA